MAKKKRNFRKEIKRLIAFVMAMCMTVLTLPSSLILFTSKAEDGDKVTAEQWATATDAEEEKYGYVTMELTGLSESEDPTGRVYSIYNNINCVEETLVGTFEISCDGKCYVDFLEADISYDQAELADEEKLQIKYNFLPVGEYYLARTDEEYLQEVSDEECNISCPAAIKLFEITEDHATVENALVLQLDASACEPLEVDTSEGSQATLFIDDDEDESEVTGSASLLSSNSIYLTNDGYTTVGNTRGGLFHVTGSLVAYCSDHYKSTPSSGTYSYSSFESPYSSVSSYGGSGANMRKVIAYGIETYGTNYSSISNANRLRMSIALYNAKYGASHSVGSAINTAAYNMFSSDPLTISESKFTFSNSKTTLSITADSTKTITTSSGASVNVKLSSTIQLKGKKANTVSFTLPSNVYVKYSGTWYSPGTTVKCKGNSKLLFAINSTVTSKCTVTLKGSTGYDVYELTTGKNYQTMYWGTSSSTTATLSITPGDDEDYLYLYKSSANENISSDDEHYNMAGIGYRIYSDADCTKEAISNNYTQDVAGVSVTVKTSSYIFLSWDGYAYLDQDGTNVIFINQDAYDSFVEVKGYEPADYKLQYASGTYYIKETSTVYWENYDNTARARYWYDTDNKDFSSLIELRADKDLTTVTGYELDTEVYTAKFSGEGESVYKEVSDKPENYGKATLKKTVNGETTSKTEGLVFYLYKMDSSEDTEITTSKLVATFTCKGKDDFSIVINDTDLEMTVSGNSLTNMPFGTYVFVEDAAVAKKLGFTVAEDKRFSLSYTNQEETITMDDDYDDTNKARVSKFVDGKISSESAGLTFYLYKMSSESDRDMDSAELIARYTSVTDGDAYNAFEIVVLTDLNNVDSAGNYVINLPTGYYAMVEDADVAASLGFTVAETEYFYLGNNDSTNIYMYDTRTSLSLSKCFEDDTVDGMENYSLEGAQFKMYLATADGVVPDLTEDNYIATFTTDANGNGYISDVADQYFVKDYSGGKAYTLRGIPDNSYVYITEVVASAGCGLAEDQWCYVDTGDNIVQAVKVEEPVKKNVLNLKLSKVDSQTLEWVGTGAATLEGATFELCYYNLGTNEVTSYEALLEGEYEPTRTWTFATDEDGIIDFSNMEYFVSGDELYVNEYGDIVLPYGVVTLEEVSAPAGYTTTGEFVDVPENENVTTEDGVLFMVLDEDSETALLSATYTRTDVALRGDLKLRKVSALTGEAMAGVAFKLTSATTGESHILVTNAEGIIDTSLVAHSENTNINDDASDGYATCGTWFYGNSELAGEISDNLGALPYDTYILEEIPGDENADCILVDTITIGMDDEALYDEDGYFICDLGDVENVPTPSISTIAKDIETATNIGRAQEDAVIVDSVYYKYLTAGETYTIKGILVDLATGEPVTMADGTYVTSMTTFTVEEEFDSFANEKCGTVDVTFAFDGTELAGKTVVVFEYLYLGKDDTAIAVVGGVIDETGVYTTNTGVAVKHDDLTDANQTIYIPEIGTSMVDYASGSHETVVSSLMTFVDTVSYSNLVIGEEYVVVGVLMNQSTGEKLLDANGNVVVGEIEFVPETANGTVEVCFEFDGSALGATNIVAFEYLYLGEALIADHTDINDESQTVAVGQVKGVTTTKKTSNMVKTGDKVTAIIGGVFALALVCLAYSAYMKRRKKK